MKAIILILVAAAFTLTGCKKCKGEDPRALIVNNGTESVSVQIMTSGGNTVNINNIDPGQSSEYVSYSAGTVTFTITIGNGGNSTTSTISVAMETCYEYEIQVDANNNLVSVPTDRNE